MKTKNFLFILVLIFMSSASFAEVGVTDKEILIGSHTVESGPFIASYPMVIKAVNAYFQSINDKGGIFGRKIKWLTKDSQGQTSKSFEVTKDLVERDKVFAIWGGQGPSHIATYKYLNEHQVPDFYFGDFSSLYEDKSLKWTFPLWLPTPFEGREEALYIAKQKKGSKFCFLQTKESMGEDYIKGAQKALTEFNTKLKDSEKIVIGPVLAIDRAANQADSEILKFKENKCDVVMTSTYGSLTPSAINFGFNQGFKPQWIVFTTNIRTSFLSLLANGAEEGIVSSSTMARNRTVSVNKEGWDEFEALMKKNNVTVDGQVASIFSAAQIFVEVLKRAGKDLDRQSLAKAGESFKDYMCPLCLVPLNTSLDSHLALKQTQVVLIKNKAWDFAK